MNIYKFNNIEDFDTTTNLYNDAKSFNDLCNKYLGSDEVEYLYDLKSNLLYNEQENLKLLQDEYNNLNIENFLKDCIVVIHPSYMKSKNDNDIHYISFERLIDLYELKRYKCKNIINFDSIIGLRRYNDDIMPYQYSIYKIIELRPKFDGNYNIEKIIKDSINNAINISKIRISALL